MSLPLRAVFTPAGIPASELAASAVVVIDVLRATTVLPTALDAGADRILPVTEIEDALRLAESLNAPGTVLLCGEREGRRIRGFDLGNSPREYTPDRVAGKTLVFCSTNGSRVLGQCRRASLLVAGSFVNAAAVVRRLRQADLPVLLVPCGTGGRASLEDLLAAGLLAERWMQTAGPAGTDADDAARVLRDLWRYRDGAVLEALTECDHGRYLQELGDGEDLRICADVDRLDVVPEWRDGRILNAAD